MIQAVFFDFNGVIVDDEPLQLEAYKEFFGRGGQELPDELLARVIDAKTAAHRKLLEGELPLFPGVVNVIKALKWQHSLGLVSMAARTEIDHVLERAALTNYFDAIVSAEDVTACKPDPSCYTKGLESLNRRRGEAH